MEHRILPIALLIVIDAVSHLMPLGNTIIINFGSVYGNSFYNRIRENNR